MPRELHSEEIPILVEAYKNAACRANDVGFDGVEVHAAQPFT
jgi:N-ethylmaleimide reductase